MSKSQSYLIPRKPIRELLDQKTRGVLYLSSTCDTDSDREDFVRRASKLIDIDAVGKCAHNTDWPARLADLEFNANGNSVRKTWGAGLYEAADALVAAYKFRFVSLNSLFDDYIAEKIQLTLAYGTIPIYLGMPNAHLWDPGLAAGVHPAMIHVTDFDTMAEMADHIRGLSVDTEIARRKRERYFEYVDRVPFSPYPQHIAKFDAKWGGEEFDQFMCHRTHDGDLERRAPPQGPTRGDWKTYFKSLGKDLTQWGVPAQ
jgi:hypothetical protein